MSATVEPRLRPLELRDRIGTRPFDSFLAVYAPIHPSALLRKYDSHNPTSRCGDQTIRLRRSPFRHTPRDNPRPEGHIVCTMEPLPQ